MRRSVVCTAGAALLLASLLGSSAWANPADLFGLGAPSMGRARAGIVLDHDPYAAWRNPSAMGLAPRDEATLTLHLGWMNLGCFGEVASTQPLTCAPNILYDGDQDGVVDPEASGDHWYPGPIEAPSGIQFGYLRAFGKWLRIGLALNFPLKRIVLFQSEDPYLPWYVRWKSRSQRLGIYLSASVRIVDGLYVGLGVSVLARARIELDFTVDALLDGGEVSEGDSEALSADLLINPRGITSDIRPTVSPIAAVTWDLGMLTDVLDGLRIGVVYRHPVTLDVDPAVLSLEFNGIVDEIGSLGEIMIPIRTQIVYSAVDFATPRQVAIGLGWDRPRFALSVDLTWNQWSTIVPNTARIDEELTDVQIGLLDLNAQVLNARQTDSLDFRDTLEIRVGGEWRPNSLPLQGKVGGRFRELGLILRAGYSYEPSFVPEQTALTNFLDNPTHVVGLGVGLWTRDPFEMLEGPISFDLFGQVHVLQDRVHVKDPTILEDPELLPTGWPLLGEVRSGGVVIVAGGGLHLSI